MTITAKQEQLLNDKNWLYEKLGFDFKNESKPNYKYFNNDCILESRIKFQKHKLESLLPEFDMNKTEWENMKNNGYNRIWDCGNKVYIYDTGEIN